LHWIFSYSSASSSVLTAQNAHSVTECVECSKPRVIYSKAKLTERQKTMLALLLSEYEYSCGSPVTPPSHALSGTVFMRLTLTCNDQIEIPYYSADIGRHDLCCYCAHDGTVVDQELKKKFKTVLPVCQACRDKSLVVPCFRPYGNSN